MKGVRQFWNCTAVVLFIMLWLAFAEASKKKDLPSVRWTAGAPGCTFERRDDGKYGWTMTGSDLAITLLMDSQELKKSRHRYFHPLSAFISVTYTGPDKFEFPADVRIEFVRHHDVCLLYTSPSPRDRQKSRMPSSA